ncbi:acyltransferase [Methylobacterium sp. WL6]|uniref:acyltransferase family protein n=1 Tax=Methylobacterium sp. WL6 TaxID=2603901 RepID=UPI0011C85708|nr:acyltransferase [Methylobacterium sp. WL6]TXN71207.1 acyltransferase [Methylobacterium sp. WL6]
MQRVQRQDWIDVARGIGIILVVFGHVLRGTVKAGIVPDTSATQWVDFGLYTFHMPLFFFLAGLNLPGSLRRGRVPFLQAKLWTIGLPYVIWTFIQGSVMILLAQDINTHVTPADLLAFPYRPLGPLWFLYALLICHVLAAMIPDRRLFAAIAAAGFVIFFRLPEVPSLALTLHNLPFYLAGAYAGHAVAAWRTPVSLSGIALIWTGFALAVVGAWTVSGFSPMALAALPACCLGILGVVWVSKRIGGGALATVGLLSLSIFVMHSLAAAGLRVAMTRLHVPPDPMVYLISGTAFGILGPMLAHRLLARWNTLSVLGLGAPPWRYRIAVSDTAR